MTYTKAELKKEREANQFALCLLMPEEMFITQWKSLRDRNIEEEKQVIMLADIFKVPLSACAVRMSQLGNKVFL